VIRKATLCDPSCAGRPPDSLGHTTEPAALEVAASWIEKSRCTWPERMDRLETRLAHLQERKNR